MSQQPSRKTSVTVPVSDRWQQGELIELTISDLADGGEGVGRFDQRVVFVPDTVPGDRALVRLVQVKSRYAWGKLHQLSEASPHRIQPRCIVADKCGGCQWQHLSDHYQLVAKQNQVIQALKRIGGFQQPTVDPVLAAPAPLGYRNKATYPLGISDTGEIKAGYYRKGSHQLINLNQCPVQDPRLNPFLAGIKQDIQDRGWPIYDEEHHQGQIRHLALRIGRRTGEILLTLVVRDRELPQIEQQAQTWLQQYPDLVGVLLNENSERTNAIFGNQTHCVAGQPYLREILAGLQFLIHPTTFFQVHTEQAEALLQVILESLNLRGNEVVVDAYCGIGTLSLPLAQRVRQVIGLEAQNAAVKQARANAQLNGLTNVTFQVGAVEHLLPKLTVQPDLIVLDPPRKGCDPAAIASLLELKPTQIVYISCKPATLARDLKILCQTNAYHLVRVQPVDFFPQTAHVECVALLVRQDS